MSDTWNIVISSISVIGSYLTSIVSIIVSMKKSVRLIAVKSS